MLLGLAIFFACAGALFSVIALHECGHFFAGIVAGIPPEQMKIRLAVFPQHVALRDGGEWISPRQHHRYAARAIALIKNKSGMIAYVSGGLVVQTAMFGAFGLIARSVGLDEIWLYPLTAALVSMPLLYLSADIAFTRATRQPCGDFSALWRISPLACVLTTGLVVIGHALVLIYVLRNA